MNLRIVRERSGEVILGVPVRVAENEPIIIELRTSRDFRIRPELTLDGQSLDLVEMIPEDDAFIWRWRFRSENWCGRTSLTLTSDGAPIAISINATPNDAKYTEREYERMLERVLSYGDTLAFGLAPGGRQADTTKTSANLRATHPAVIECYLPPLREQLQRILADPVREHRRQEIYAKLSPARPIAPRTLTWLAAHPNQLEAARSGDFGVECLQQVRHETHDHPANRYLVALLRRLRLSFEATASALESFSRGQLVGDLEANRARLLATRTRHASHHVTAALRHPVLAGLQPGELTEGVAQIFADHPAYARFCKLAARLLDGAVALSASGDLASSLRRSWDLFELYALYRLMEALEAQLGADWTIERTAVSHHVLTMPALGRFWCARHRDGRSLALHYQQRFGASPRGPLTITTHRRPDFVAALYDGSKLRSWALLDAKYRTAKVSIREALESMHVYRDSLRWRCDTTGTEQRAGAGFLLVPTIAPSSLRFGNASFIAKRNFGLIAIDDGALGPTLLTALDCHPD